MITPIRDWRRYRFGFEFAEPYPQGWGEVSGQPHLGIDILCPRNTPVYAPVDGTVTETYGEQGGLQIHLKAGRLVFRFMHLNKVVKTGKVKEGDKIALSGNSGSVTSTPHLHDDISRDSVQLGNIDNFIDPVKLHEMPVRVALLGRETLDLARIELDYAYMGVYTKIDQIEFTEPPKWVKTIGKKHTVDDTWWDVNIAPLVSGYDIAILITDYWKRESSDGYAEKKQRHGIWRGFVEDTGKKREYYASHWNGKPQVVGTFAHELSHLMNYATDSVDKTHTLDQAGEILDQRFDMERFNGWDVPGMVRVFRWAETFERTKGSPWSLQKVKSKKLVSRLVTPEHAAILKKSMETFIPKWK